LANERGVPLIAKISDFAVERNLDPV
jgi:hypothetical protein